MLILIKIERSKAQAKRARIKIMMQGSESISHNAKTCKDTKVGFKFGLNNNIGSLFVIMNRKKC